MWVFTRNGVVWSQQGFKLFPSDASREAHFGSSVSINSDGTYVVVGGEWDNDEKGAIWVFSRKGVVWTQQGFKLVPSDAAQYSRVGYSVSINSDGKYAVVGGSGDNNHKGAIWTFFRNGAVWSQKSLKLVPSDATPRADVGCSVSINSDGTYVLVGGQSDNDYTGAMWIFIRQGVVWSQQGLKLIPTDLVPTTDFGVGVGFSVSINSDSTYALVIGYGDNNSKGAVWVFTRIGSDWFQNGFKLVPSDATVKAYVGSSVSINSDGTYALVGGYRDNNYQGAVWPYSYIRANVLAHNFVKLVPSDALQSH
jgi:hypothetical protein